MNPTLAPHSSGAASAGSASTRAARSVLIGLLRGGVRDVVVAPGSRSAPLTYAIAQLAEAGLLDVRVRIDEREAAFLALGIAKGRRARGAEAPVAVVTTSGSAVANLHPAVLEASYGHVPLIALTADRPARLRATGANQTIDDQSLVLSDVRGRIDVPADDSSSDSAACEDVGESAARIALGEGFASGRTPGPVQLNVQFDVPLVPEPKDMAPWWPKDLAEGVRAAGANAAGGFDAPSPPRPLAPDMATSVLPALASRAVILAGDTFDFPASRLLRMLEALPVPVLAEPSSPLAGSPCVIPDHTRVLDAAPDLVDAVTDLVVVGKPTLFRQDQCLLAREGLRVHRIQPDLDLVSHADWSDALQALPEATREPEWLARWQHAMVGLGSEESDSPEPGPAGQSVREPATPRAAAIACADAVLTIAQPGPDQAGSPETGPGNDKPGTMRVFAGSSNSIRYLHEADARRGSGYPDNLTPRPRVHASRGLAGIDGLVSTALGFSQGVKAPVRLLIGDVSLLHGIGGLLREPGETAGDLQIVVLNDDGGAIFSGLEHGGDHVATYLRRFFATAHGRSFADSARAYGWRYVACSTPDELRAVLDSAGDGIIEVALPPTALPPTVQELS